MGKMKCIAAALALGFICAPAPLRAEGPLPVIKGLRVVSSGDALGVEISADKDLAYTCTKIAQLLRIVIDLPRTEPGGFDTVYKIKSTTMISTIRVEKKTINDVMLTRVSVNLAEDADFTVQADPADKRKMTVFLHRPATAPSAGTAAAAPAKTGAGTETTPEKLPATAAPSPKAVAKPAASETSRSSRSVTVSRVEFTPDAIEIRTGSSISQYRAFTLREPGRLVIDIPAGQSMLRSIVVPENRFGIVTARIGYFEGNLRLVFDAGKNPFPGYRVLKTDTGLRVAP